MTPEAWYIIAMGIVILIAIAISHRSLVAEIRGEPRGEFGALHRELEKLLKRAFRIPDSTVGRSSE